MPAPQRLDRSPDRRHNSIPTIDAVEVLESIEVEHWHTLFGPGDVRKLSLEQLDDFFRTGVIDERTFLWQTGMSEWKRLETVLAEHPEPAVDEPEEPFHVLMQDRSVKLLSLEQIDDFYRLGILEEQTYLWQKGMSGWQRLATLAGLDEPEASTSPTNERPRESSIPTARYNATPTVIDNVAPTTRFEQPFVYQVLSSTPPVTVTLTPEPIAPVSASSDRWLIRLAILVAAVFVLGRNDALWFLANTVKQGPGYLKSEQRAFGGPLFGTTRAVEKLISDTGGPLQPVRVPVVVAELTPHAPTPAVSPGQAAPGPSSTAKVTPAPNASVLSSALSKVAPAPPLSGPIAAALLGQATKPQTKPSTVQPSAGARKKTHKATQRVGSGSTNYYDPLNGAL